MEPAIEIGTTENSRYGLVGHYQLRLAPICLCPYLLCVDQIRLIRLISSSVSRTDWEKIMEKQSQSTVICYTETMLRTGMREGCGLLDLFEKLGTRL